MDALNQRRPRFDGTINLGNIIQIVAIIGGLWVWGTKNEVRTAALEMRITYVENAQKDVSASMRSIADSQLKMTVSQERQAATLEQMARQGAAKN